MVCTSACLALMLLSADTGTAPAPAAAAPATELAAAGPVAPQPTEFAALAPPSLGDDAASAPAGLVAPPADTVPAHPRAFEYSDAYGTRLTIHRIASYAMIPLFVASFASGSQLYDKGRAAPAWARDIHRPAATGTALLFGVNTVTGGWNLLEARHDPEGRTRRTLHGLLMLAADAGFAATGIIASDAAENSSRRQLHRNVAWGSMGVSLVSYAIMLPIFGGGK
jgi:hypothetical protein